jgi:hypothetical protein
VTKSSLCSRGCGKPEFARKLCRKSYSVDLAVRKADGDTITRGNDPVNPTGLVCAHDVCRKAFRGSTLQARDAADGKPVYCAKACRMTATSVMVPCAAGCGRRMRRYRSRGYDETSRALCGEVCTRKVGLKPRKGSSKPCGLISCGRPVYRPASWKEGKPRFCDEACWAKSMVGTERVERPEVSCQTCGEIMRLNPNQRIHDVRTHAGACTAAARRRKPGERYIDQRGYAVITAPDGRSMFEHRWVMEQAIGRALFPEETVHHKTGGRKGRSNNELSNLELWTGRHPKGHRVEDVVTYSLETLVRYGPHALRQVCEAFLAGGVETMVSESLMGAATPA